MKFIRRPNHHPRRDTSLFTCSRIRSPTLATNSSLISSTVTQGWTFPRVGLGPASNHTNGERRQGDSWRGAESHAGGSCCAAACKVPRGKRCARTLSPSPAQKKRGDRATPREAAFITSRWVLRHVSLGMKSSGRAGSGLLGASVGFSWLGASVRCPARLLTEKDFFR